MKLIRKNRVMATLKDSKGNVIERRIVDQTFERTCSQLGLKSNTDSGDIIIIEEEGK